MSSSIGPIIPALGFQNRLYARQKSLPFVPDFHEIIRQPLRGVFDKRPLKKLSGYIELSPVTWVRVVLELFPQALEVVIGNCEFVVPERFALFVGGLEGYRTLGRFAENFYQS